MIRVLLSKSTCLIMKFANRVIVSANRKCTWNSREIRTWKRVVLMGKRLKIIYIKILWGGKYNKYIIKFVLWDCFLDIFAVEAYTASWIEILSLMDGAWSQGCRSLYGFVDWNLCLLRLQLTYIPSKPIRLRGLKWDRNGGEWKWILSKPIRLRGLKLPTDKVIGINFIVEAYTASWIEIP